MPTRQRKPQKTTTKEGFHSGSGLRPTKGHQHKATTTCQAEKLSPDDLMMNFNKFDQITNKVDRAILNLLDITNVKSQRLKVQDVNK